MFRSALRLHRTIASPIASSYKAIARFHSVPGLPYVVTEGVRPLLSPAALKLIYADHQTGLVNRLNELIAGTPYEEKLYYEILIDSARSLNDTQIFNNASQAWNNDFFLRSLSPKPSDMSEALAKKISESFGSDKDGRLVLLNTYNAGSPHHRRRMQREDETATDQDFATTAQNPHAGVSKFSAPPKLLANNSYVPILCISMWEHAYMTDYGLTRDGRKEYVANFFKTVDWNSVDNRVFRVSGF
ncbi:hypothetical protein BGW38_001673 [Lunasporangiospora selenospora]|uniref:Superoxide dismutase n=1 Tax=Lunasporangiospora selenospora TaxID=979761 RepID=A0A9P6G1Y5_9FUNG|nr:hypothetical protein BGW38_001673 [Lunasporangiospora selenospora]